MFPVGPIIVQFRDRYDRWKKEVKTHFLQPSSEVNKFTNSYEKKTFFITLSTVYFQISNTYLTEFVKILLYVEANPVWMCR